MPVTRITNAIMYPAIGRDLRQFYSSYGRYLMHQRYNRSGGHFLQPVTPYNEQFFGTKALNILIIQSMYDWEDDTFLQDLENAKRIIKDNFHKWPYYKVIIYVDGVFATLCNAAGDSSYEDQRPL